MHQRIGIPSLLITADDVRRLAPSFATDDFEFAAFEPESGYADPSATTGSLDDRSPRTGRGTSAVVSRSRDHHRGRARHRRRDRQRGRFLPPWSSTRPGPGQARSHAWQG